MSTSSDDEAIACLKMARKKGNNFDTGASATYNGQTAEYWYQKAHTYYDIAKKKQDQPSMLNVAQQTQLYRMYQDAENEKIELYNKLSKASSENSELTRKLTAKKNVYVFSGVLFGFMLAIIPVLIIIII